MNKRVKKILIIVGAIVIILTIFVIGFMLKMKSEINKLESMETKELTENVFTIQDSFANLFVIKDSIGYIVIDCGIDPKVVSDELRKLQINVDSVTAVLLTHTDDDHVGALDLFAKAKLYISKEETQMINGKKSRFFVVNNHINRTDYIELDNHQTINIGNTKIQGLLTPGHTPGSMCYLINDKYLFTGDAISLKDGKMGHGSEFFEMDTDQATKSIELLRNIPGVQYIFTAHHGYTDDYMNAVK